MYSIWNTVVVEDINCINMDIYITAYTQVSNHIMNAYFFTLILATFALLLPCSYLSCFAAKLCVHVSDGLLWRSVIRSCKMRKEGSSCCDSVLSQNVWLIFYLAEINRQIRTYTMTVCFGKTSKLSSTTNQPLLWLSCIVVPPVTPQHLPHVFFM